MNRIYSYAKLSTIQVMKSTESKIVSEIRIPFFSESFPRTTESCIQIRRLYL